MIVILGMRWNGTYFDLEICNQNLKKIPKEFSKNYDNLPKMFTKKDNKQTVQVVL